MSEDDLLIQIGLNEKRYFAMLARIESQTNRSAKKVEDHWKKSNQGFVRGAEKANKSANSLANGGLKNIGMQLSQVAQQGAATGDYLKAMSIQAADIGMAFGGLGIAIGTVLTVLTPLAVEMLASGEAGRDLEEVFEDLGAAISKLEAARGGAARSRPDLVQEYDVLARQAERLFEIERQIAEQRAAAAVQDATRSVVKGMGTAAVFGLDPDDIRESEAAIQRIREEIAELSGSTSDYTEEHIRAVQALREQAGQLRLVSKNFDELARMLGVSEDAAREIAARFAEITSLEPGQKQADAFAELTTYIWQTSDGLEDATKEGESLYDRFREAALAALDVAKTDIASPIGSGADQAERLADNLARAASNGLVIAGIGPAFQRDLGGGVQSDPTFMGGANFAMDNMPASPDWLKKIAAAQAALAKKNARGTGKSDAVKEAEEYARLAQRYIDQTRTALEEYNAELALLEELNRRGFFKDHPEAYARAVAQVEAEFNRAQFDAYREGVEGFTEALFKGGDALKDWARNAVLDLAKVITQMMILKALGLPTDGVMSGGGFLGKIFAGFFDGGGNIPAGQFGIAGENGPEIIRGPAHVTSTVDTARMMSAGGSVRLIIEEAPGFAATVRSEARGVAVQTVQQGIGQYDRSLPDRLSQIRADPRARS